MFFFCFTICSRSCSQYAFSASGGRVAVSSREEGVTVLDCATETPIQLLDEKDVQCALSVQFARCGGVDCLTLSISRWMQCFHSHPRAPIWPHGGESRKRTMRSRMWSCGTSSLVNKWQDCALRRRICGTLFFFLFFFFFFFGSCAEDSV